MTKMEFRERLTSFAARIIRVCEVLSKTHPHAAPLNSQLFRSATGVAANYAEACEAESRDDFIHKMKIAMKELSETQMWLQIILKANYMTSMQLNSLLAETTELVNVFGASVATARRNATNEKTIS